jgi:protein O-GlcNAc transferase
MCSNNKLEISLTILYSSIFNNDCKSLTHNVDIIHTLLSTERISDSQTTLLYKMLEYSMLQKKYSDFFCLSSILIRTIPCSERSPLYAVLSQLAQKYMPELVSQFDGLWLPEDLLDKRIFAFMKTVAQDDFDTVADGIEHIAEKKIQNEFMYFSLIVRSISYYSLSGNMINAERLLKIAFQSEILNSLFFKVNKVNTIEQFLITKAVLFPLCSILPYVTDKYEFIKTYQNKSANLFSQYVRSYWPQKYSVPAMSFEQNTYKIKSRPLRVGYLSSAMRRHSVGFLSYQTILNHNSEQVNCFYYSYKRSSIKQDNIEQYFINESDNYRDFSKFTPVNMLKQIRNDNLDILVYVDDSYTAQGCEILSMRAAPTQVYWLGGDSPGLPQIDYFMIDPHLLGRNAQKNYNEKFIYLPSFVAVDSFDVHKIDTKSLKKELGIQEHNIVFWTASIAKKRSIQCICSQLRIIKGVPNALLVVKSSRNMFTIEKLYKEIAIDENVELNRLIFIGETPSEEEHRGLLSLADIVLDTFPYTGATHTLEALWCNIPVLTKVCNHYYGRMSYSLLKNISLDLCVTWSNEEYIKRGIQLGCNKYTLNQARNIISDSFSQSIIWNTKKFISFVEKAYLDICTN